MLVTSETNASEIVLTSSWLGGNLGAGARVADFGEGHLMQRAVVGVTARVGGALVERKISEQLCGGGGRGEQGGGERGE